MSDLNIPRFSQTDVSKLLEQLYGLVGQLKALPSYCDQNFLLEDVKDNSFVIKIANAEESIDSLQMQNAAMVHLRSTGKAPSVINNLDGKEFSMITDASGSVFFLRVLTFINGTFYADTSPQSHNESLWQSLGSFMGEMTRVLSDFDHIGAHRKIEWDLAHGYVVCKKKTDSLPLEQRSVVEHFLHQYQQQVKPLHHLLPQAVIHNDANDHNLLVNDKLTPSEIVAIIDFGDMVYSHRIGELAITCAYAMMNQPNPRKVLLNVVKGYHQHQMLTEEEFEALFPLITLRLCTSLCNAALALKSDPNNEYLSVSVKPAWSLLQVFQEWHPFSVICELKNACNEKHDKGKPHKELAEFRAKHMGKNLSLTFDKPLKIIKGQGVFLYDDQGVPYLDMVNNVCHVGHCHPSVVKAGQKQMALLNTNTRFLHDNIVSYAEKLLNTFPDPLSVVMFVNSGSEANELALRLARQYTGSEQIVTVEGAYHGNTGGCVNISPYKFDGPGGQGAPSYVYKTTLPDPYRGKYQGDENELSDAYAQDVQSIVKKLEAKQLKPAAFICESLQGVAGQIIMPHGYLKKAYAHIRDAGGLCIADEVQVGFGRVGSRMWAFETQDVIPDIVTLGKPIGNGHPLGAVVTTKEIADAFANGMEYFNTFGGNPVSCAIGEAVLDVIQDEELQKNALETGHYMMVQLKKLQQQQSMIGDVRGLGLFVGVELVLDKNTKQPATKETKRLVEYLKSQQIILTSEGPYHNVLKIKPPIVFNKTHVDMFLSKLESGLNLISQGD